MDLALLDRKLEKAFTRRRRLPQLGGGTIVWRQTPAPLWQYVAEIASEDDRDEVGDGSFEDWPGNVSALLGDRLLDVLGFYWDGFGPMSWAAGIQVLDCGEHGWLCHWNEMESYRTVARIERWRQFPNLASSVTTLLAKNGARQGLDVFGSLPTETTNYLPELLPTETVRNAYFDWLQWSDGWNDLAEEHFGRIVETNHLQRCLDILRSLPQHNDPDAVAAYLEDDDLPELDDKAKRSLFDDWFATVYSISAAAVETAEGRE